MPIRRRLSVAPVRDVDPVSAFRWTVDGDGYSDHALRKPAYRDRREAERAWQQARRAVWATCHRFAIPPTAKTYDGLTTGGVEFVRWHWNHVGPFDLAGALAALAEDRANLARFLATPGARTIADYLAVLDADFDRTEETARAFAAWPATDVWRPFPSHLQSGQRYGSARLDGNDGPAF